MKRFLTALTLLLVLFSSLLPSPVAFAAPEEPADSMRGMLIRTRNNRDFPTAPGQSPRELKRQLQTMVEFSAQNRINTIFFEVVPSADGLFLSKSYPASRSWVKAGGSTPRFDPLQTLIRLADKRSIRVVAVINPYLVGDVAEPLPTSGPAADPQNRITLGRTVYLDPNRAEVENAVSDRAAELAARDPLAGIAYHQADHQPLLSLTGYEGRFTALLQSTKAKLPSTPLGVLVADDSPLAPALFQLAQEGTVDFLLPQVTHATGADGRAVRESLRPWAEAAQEGGIPFYTQTDAVRLFIPSDSSGEFSSPGELAAQWEIGWELGSSGFLLDSYTALREPYQSTAELLLAYQVKIPDLNLTPISQEFQITRPQAPLRTSLSNYYLMGTSRPGEPVLLDGEEIPSDPRTGLFGILLPLSPGENRFALRQGDETCTAVITQAEPAATIGGILSPYPQDSALAWSGERLTLFCTAPSGGSVTASVGGTAIPLSQVEPKADGLPARFEGSFLAPAGFPGETQSIGPVTYQLTYQGKSSRVDSSGEVFLAGEGAKPSLRLTDYLTAVYGDPPVEGDFRFTVKEGMTAEILDETESHYQIAGGMVKKSACQVLTGPPPQTHGRLGGYTHYKEGRREEILLFSTVPVPVETQFDGTSLTLTLYETEGLPDPTLPEDSLFATAKAEREGSVCRLIFTLQEGQQLWGYQFSYQGNDLLLTCRSRPEPSSIYGKPLTGVKVVLDPGHGGQDPGALGVPGENGPMEAELNLAVAKALSFRLEQLGASVILTRQEDGHISLNDRMRLAEKAEADFFLSLHHNSTAEQVDSGKASGVEVYYHEPHPSQKLAEEIAQRLSAAAGRPMGGAMESYYRVTRMTYAPSVLVELGYLPNPGEYSDLATAFSIGKEASAIAEALVACL